jgi:DNA-binding MarR family transcriptional regulator
MMARSFLHVTSAFVWACWGELGVPGGDDRRFDLAIDLESLIFLTDAVADDDARLRSHADAWIAAFPEFVSKARLKGLTGSTAPRSEIRRTPSAIDLSGPAHVDVSHGSAVQLRIRAALGVSARAEIVRQLTLDPEGTRRTAADLAQLCGYTKRNIEKALENLERSGWVRRIRGGATLRWTLAHHETFRDLFAPVPAAAASFLALAQIAQGTLSLDQFGSEPPQVRSAMARQILVEHGPTADWGGIILPDPPPGEDAWDSALTWVSGLPATAT